MARSHNTYTNTGRGKQHKETELQRRRLSSLDAAFKHLHSPVCRYCCDIPHTSQFFVVFFFLATLALMVFFFQISAPLLERSTCEPERCCWEKRITGTSLDVLGFSHISHGAL